MIDKLMSVARFTERELIQLRLKLRQLFPPVRDELFSDIIRRLDAKSTSDMLLTSPKGMGEGAED